MPNGTKEQRKRVADNYLRYRPKSASTLSFEDLTVKHLSCFSQWCDKTKLSVRARVSIQNVTHWSKGRSVPSSKLLPRLAYAMDLIEDGRGRDYLTELFGVTVGRQTGKEPTTPKEAFAFMDFDKAFRYDCTRTRLSKIMGRNALSRLSSGEVSKLTLITLTGSYWMLLSINKDEADQFLSDMLGREISYVSDKPIQAPVKHEPAAKRSGLWRRVSA